MANKKIKFIEIVALVNQMTQPVSGHRAVSLAEISESKEFQKFNEDVRKQSEEYNKEEKELLSKRDELGDEQFSVELNKLKESKHQFATTTEFEISDVLAHSVYGFSENIYEDVLNSELQISLADFVIFEKLLKRLDDSRKI